MTIINEDLRSNGQKQAGQHMQGNLQLLQLIMNNIPQAVFWKDKDLVYLGCNRAFAEDAGFASPEDVIGKTDFDMPWKDQAELYRADDSRVMEIGKPKLNYEEPQTTPNGSRIWLNTSKIPVYENEHVVAVLGMYEDITQRKQAEEATRDERQRFRTILETIRVPTIISRLSDGIVLYANEAIAQVSQVNLDNLIGFKTGNFYANPDDRKTVLASLQEHGYIHDFEVQFRRTDGSLYWALLSSRIVKYEGETCVLSTYIDITERKQAEVAVQESRARFQGLVETLNDWIWEVDQNGAYTYVSPKIKDLLGYEPEEVLGKTPFDLMPPEEAQRVAGVFGPLLSTQQPLVALENTNVHKDGHLVVFETSGSPFFDTNGNFKGYRGTDRDITDRKRAEEFLRQSEATLSSALSVAQMGYWEFDIPTQIFTFNDQYYALHGRTALEVGGYQMSVQKFAQEFVYPEDAASVGQATQQAIETTDPDFHVETEARILHADGRPRWVTIWFRIEKDAQGRTIKLHGVNQDITARKELEAQVQEAFERRGLQVQLSTQVSQSIASAASLEELYERVVTQVKEQFGYYHTQLLRYDASQEAVVLVTGYGEVGAKMLAAGHRLPMGEGLIGTAAATGETVVRPTLESDPDWQPNPLLPKTRGEIAVPIKLENTILGVLDVQSNIAGALNTDDQLLLEGLCGQIATAIESTRLRQEMAEKLEEINRLYRAMSHEAWQTYREGQNIATGFMFDQAGLRPVKDIELTDELFANIPLVVPGGEVIGSLAVADDPQRPISPDDETFLQQVSEQLALALESARLFEQTEQQRSQLSEALKASRLAYWEYDFVNDLFTFNDDFYAIFRTTAEREGGYVMSSAQYGQRFVYPDDLPVVGAEIQKAIETTDPNYSVQMDHRAIFADGEVGYINVRFQIEKDDQGRTVRSYGANQDITERKKAEEILRVSETRLSEALNIAKLANWEYDVNRDRFIFNDHFYSIFRTTAQEVGGYELSSAEYAARFVHPDDGPMVGEEIGKALASTDRHYNVHLEHRILFVDGDVGYLSADVHIERDEQGNIIRYYGANQDITERKLAEEAIKEEQQRTQAALIESRETQKLIRNVIDSTDDWIFVKDREHRYQLVNQGYAKALHISVEDFIGKTDLDLGFPEELVIGNPEKGIRGFWSDDVLVMESGMPQHFPDDPATIDGQVHIFDTIKVPLRDESGNIWGVLAFARDVTERKNAENIIAQRAAQLATVASLSSTTSTLLDPDKLLQTVVDLTKERFDLYHAHIYLAEESWNTLLLAAGADEVGRQMVAEGWNIPLDHEQSIVARAARTRQSVIANDVVRDKSSSFLSNQLLADTRSEMALPMIVGQKLLGVFDVQANKVDYFTEEDANIYTTLAAQVAIALQNARLYKEQAATVTQLRELDKLKSSFLANMSHELRTPLNSILGFTDVMLEELDGPLTEHMDNDLRLIQKNGQHLLHLINDVLDMAKIEAGRMNLNPETFQAQEVLEEVTSITSTLASEKDLSLYIQEDSDKDVKIYADRTRLRQVMINLVNNSIKFTDKGKVILNISRIDGARILISVKDTGIGIPPEKLEAIFQEFTQVDSSSTRKAGGTGLGLPISRRLVEMHGGRLWAESSGTPGEGSTFFVELPIEARITEVVEKQAK